MRMVKRLAACAILLSIPRLTAAQVTVSPHDPRWGEQVTVTADPAAMYTGPRFFPSDRMYAVLSIYRQGRTHDRVWTSMTWDGHQFKAQLTLPSDCEGGNAVVATADQWFSALRQPFVCRRADGTLPHGAVITALAWGDRDAANWRGDVDDDLRTLRTGDGWAYSVAWLFAWNKGKTPPAQRIAEVQRVEREHARDTDPALLASIAVGYMRAGDVSGGFERLQDLCQRYPHAEHTVDLALYVGTSAIVNNPEYEARLNELLAGVANRAPENKGLRELFTRVATKAPGVSLDTVRAIAQRWFADEPDAARPHEILAAAIVDKGGAAADAEAEATKAIERMFAPHAYDYRERGTAQHAYRLRSRLRAARHDYPNAIADARMAQMVADDNTGADDLAAEAALWARAGHRAKAQSLASRAYVLGSVAAEAVLKEEYVHGIPGSERGFADYLIGILRNAEPSTARALKAVPEFTATTLDGTSVSLSSLRGHITVVDFWFIGCPPCRAERPKLNAIVDEVGDRARFLSFALDQTDALKTYLKENPFKYAIVPNAESVARAFGVDAYPTHMIIDPAGQVIWISGSDPDRIDRLRAMIFRLLATSHEVSF